jgi:DNA recombination protein RmuC
MENLYIIAAVLVGTALGFIIRKLKSEQQNVSKTKFDELNEKYQKLKEEFYFFSKENEKLSAEIVNSKNENENLHKLLQTNNAELAAYKERNAHLNAENEKLETGAEKDQEFMQEQAAELQELKERKATLSASLESLEKSHNALKTEHTEIKDKLNKEIEKFSSAKEYISEISEQNKHLQEKLDTERKDLENIKEKFTNEFKVLADKVLEEKSVKFTDQNKQNIEGILNPLGKEIAEFKKKVEETYTNETRERHSLEKAIKQLAEQNIRISEEANNLTQALRGSSKQQGDWGEMILESILEHSGLQKNREYFVQDTLKDEDGNSLKSDSGRRMQPDIRIKYPDGKGNIIIDSKVSLTAYERFSSAQNDQEQQKALAEHLISIKKHIDELSEKKYHDYTEGTDFTMMFVPIEPAYMTAMQADPNLWNYAYQKRIILISPTNLIAALKLVKDMWERKYQNDHALEIADRGGKLYDKFVNFTESLEEIGKHLERSKESHERAMSQLSSGRGNLIRQVEQLKELRVKTEKQLPASLLDKANEIE